MKKCVVCTKEISEKENVCRSCEQFLKWKHKSDFGKRISEFDELNKKNQHLRLIKFRRKK